MHRDDSITSGMAEDFFIVLKAIAEEQKRQSKAQERIADALEVIARSLNPVDDELDGAIPDRLQRLTEAIKMGQR